MDLYYPYTTPQVLTEAIYHQYNGWTGSATASQLADAFVEAETNASTELGTYLIPTTITGSCMLPNFWDQKIVLPVGHVSEVVAVGLLNTSTCDCSTELVTNTTCAFLDDEYAGVVHIRHLDSVCPCVRQCSAPYKIQLVFTAGFPAGFAVGQPNIKHALAVAAQISLEQVLDPNAAEGGAGDPGIRSWRSLGYSEERIWPKDTAFGGSARANYAAKLLSKFKVYRPGKAGW